MNTLIALCIAPCGTGDEYAPYVAEIVKIIRASGLKNRTNSMFTEVEGEWDDVMAVVKKMYVPPCRTGHPHGSYHESRRTSRTYGHDGEKSTGGRTFINVIIRQLRSISSNNP